MGSQLWSGQPGEARPQGQSGLREGLSPGHTLRTLRFTTDLLRPPSPCYREGSWGPERAGTCPRWHSMLGKELGWQPGLLKLNLLFSLSRKSPSSLSAPEIKPQPVSLHLCSFPK